MKLKASTLQKVEWKEVRDKVVRVNPELAQAIDEVDPGPEYYLYLATFPFGADIVKNGKLNLPNSFGSLVPFDHSDIDPKIQNDLGYTGNMPNGILLDNVIEIWMNTDPVIPWHCMHPGKIFGLWSTIEGTKINSYNAKGFWNVSSAPRSLFFLSYLSNSRGIKRIAKEFNIKFIIPQAYYDQRNLLVSLANADNFPTNWESKLLFFPIRWNKAFKSDSLKWKVLQNYLWQYLWQDTAFLREKEIEDFAFSLAMTQKNLRPNPYLADTVRHIYISSMTRKYSTLKVGFQFANNNSAGPIDIFQKIFSDLYDMKFSPTIVHPGLISLENPLYYSLETPTVWSYLPKSRKAANKLNDLREMKHVQEAVAAYTLDKKNGLADTQVYERVKNTQFDYYHTDPDPLGDITLSSKIAEVDPTFKKEFNCFKKPFCDKNPFLRGCVRISLHKEK